MSLKSEAVDIKSLRNFGFIWAGIFCLIAFYPLTKGQDLKLWAAYISILFLAVSVIDPSFYQKIRFYQGWIKFGNIIGGINSKIIIFILFYVIFLPIGIFLKIAKKDLLNKKIDASAESYFIERKSQPSNMENQF